MKGCKHLSENLLHGSQGAPFAAWVVAVMVYIVLAAVTLPVSPGIYPDEVMVTDYGRNVLEHPTEWSVVWNFATDSPRVPTYWFGCVIQELACRLSGESFLGARFSGVLGSIAAASFLLLWMRAAGVQAGIALAGATAFLWDPLLFAVSRSGRPDTWAMAFALAACWLVRLGAQRHQRGERAGWPMAAAGVCAAVAPFCWISAVFPLLLVATELVRLPIQATGRWPEALTGSLRPWFFFAVGAVAAAAVLVGSVWQIWPEAISQTMWLAEVAASQGTLLDGGSFVTSFRADPLLLPAVAISCALLWRRDWLLVTAVGVTTFFLLQSMVYHFRAGYALPAYYAVVTAACGLLWASGKSWSRKLAVFVLGILLLWNAAVSFGLRGWIAMERAQANDPAQLLAAAQSHVGAGPRAVFDANMVFYYAGRQLGWRMFRPEVAHNYGLSEWNDEMFADFLRRVDVAIVPEPGQIWNAERFSRDEGAVLRRAGFLKKSSFAIGGKAHAARSWWDRVLLGGGPNYGAFAVYARPGVELPATATDAILNP